MIGVNLLQLVPSLLGSSMLSLPMQYVQVTFCHAITLHHHAQGSVVLKFPGTPKEKTGDIMYKPKPEIQVSGS